MAGYFGDISFGSYQGPFDFGMYGDAQSQQQAAYLAEQARILALNQTSAARSGVKPKVTVEQATSWLTKLAEGFRPSRASELPATQDQAPAPPAGLSSSTKIGLAVGGTALGLIFVAALVRSRR